MRGRKLRNSAQGPLSAADACGGAARGTACTACILRRTGMPGRRAAAWLGPALAEMG